jgi:hypothetical protein
MAQSTTITLPKGIARFPSLHRPDTKFNDLGVYKANVAVPAEEAEAVMKQLQAIAKAELGKALPKSDNSLWKMEIDDNGDETGMVMFKASVKNIQKKDGELWDRKPKQYDADLKVVNEVIFGGSELIINCEVRVWEFSGKKGISLQPRAVQIIKLVGPSESDNPFEKQDGGFVGSGDVPSFAPVTTPDEIEEIEDF